MQTTIVDRTSKSLDHDIVMALHEREEILSVTVRKGPFTKTKNAKESDSFAVFDLLKDSSYLVMAYEDRQQLIFPAKDECVIVILAAGSDVTKAADHLTDQLEIIRSAN